MAQSPAVLALGGPEGKALCDFFQAIPLQPACFFVNVCIYSYRVCVHCIFLEDKRLFRKHKVE